MLPVHGQELLAFRWKMKPESKKLLGQFAGRPVKALKNGTLNKAKREAKLLRNSWSSLEKAISLFLASLKTPEQFCTSSKEGFDCRSLGSEKLKWTTLGDEARAVARLSDSLQLAVRLYDRRSDGFHRFELFVHELPKGPQSRPTLGLELFADGCELP